MSFNIIYPRFIDSTTLIISHSHPLSGFSVKWFFSFLICTPNNILSKNSLGLFASQFTFAHSICLKFPLVFVTLGEIYIIDVRIAPYNVTWLHSDPEVPSQLPFSCFEIAVCACVKQDVKEDAFLPLNTRLGT